MLGYPFVPAVFIVCTLGFASLAALHRPLESLIGLATIAIGLVLYAVFTRDDGPRRQGQAL
jgi:ABC-type tungstate transport system substrate-binding protein